MLSIEIRNTEDLRFAYTILRMRETAPYRLLSADRNAAWIRELKENIRSYLHRPIRGGAVVKDYGDGSAIILQELPETIQTPEEADEYFRENLYMECRPSMYDCTGQLFTHWYKIFRRRGRFMVYHSVGCDN